MEDVMHYLNLERAHARTSKYAITQVIALSALVALPAVLSSANAADLGGPPAAYTMELPQLQSSAHRNFYVRGDVGVARNTAKKFSQQDLGENGGSILTSGVDDTVYIGAGFGWQFSRRFRADMTGEYRSTTRIKVLDNLTANLTGPDGTLQANTLYDGNLSSVVGLVNGYWDIVNYRGFTPYVGAGVGFARHTISNLTTLSNATFTDTSGVQTSAISSGLSSSKSQTNLAWALMAGTSYDLSQSAKLDLGYRYLNLGSGISAGSDLINCACGTVGAPLKVSDLHAHEMRIGVRWALGEPPRYDAVRSVK
jgi:opacity protein-like surface antigen